MAMRFHHLAVLLAALVATLACSPLARADDAPSSIDEVYRQIKDAERAIPVPTPLATVNIGRSGSTPSTSGSWSESSMRPCRSVSP